MSASPRADGTAAVRTEAGPTPIDTPGFWVAEWRAHQQRTGRQASPYHQRTRWDHMAEGYGRSGGGRTSERRRLTLERLVARGILREGIRILDVGCGPGSFAIPFAERGAQVVALDFSPAMIRRLEEETPPELAGRIDARVADWKGVDLVREGFARTFVFVFANMTPAVSAPEGFLKLSEASRDWCLFTGWAGKRENVLEEQVWRHLTGTERPRFSSDIIFPFNLLYAQGYLPEMDFEEMRWQHEVTVAEETQSLVESLEGELDLSKEELGLRIGEYLETCATDGKVTRATDGLTGQMLWQIGRTR